MAARTSRPTAGLRGCLWAVLAWAAAAPCEAQVQAMVLPAREVVTVRPGLPAARQITVTNRGDAPVIVRPRLSDWTMDERGEMQFLPAGSTRSGLGPCLRFEPAVFTLPPGESGRVELTLDLPADGPPTRWGVVLCEVRPATPRRASLGSRAIAELGTTIYLTRVPPGPSAAEVTGLWVAARGSGSTAVTVRVRNAGERQYHVGGGIELADSSGRAVAAGPLPTGVVLPGHERELTWTCDAAFAPGSYRAIATLDTGEPELLVAESRVRLPAALLPSLASRR